MVLCLLLAGGPSVSVAVKRSGGDTAHDVVKRPARQSVKSDVIERPPVKVNRDSLQVFTYMHSTRDLLNATRPFLLMPTVANVVICAFVWHNGSGGISRAASLSARLTDENKEEEECKIIVQAWPNYIVQLFWQSLYTYCTSLKCSSVLLTTLRLESRIANAQLNGE